MTKCFVRVFKIEGKKTSVSVVVGCNVDLGI